MKKTAIFTTIALLLVAALVPTAVADEPAWVVVETVNVPAPNVQVVTSSMTLVDGWPYTLEASGTYDAVGNGSILADAEYATNDGWATPNDFVPGYEVHGECLLELKVDDTCVEWGPYDPGHVYDLDYPGTGDKVDFQINDLGGGTNNVGQLTAKILATPVMVSTAIISGPYDVNVGEVACWEIEITVKAMYADVTDVVVQDGMGADLDANDTPVSISKGDATIAQKTVGKGKHKMRATMVTWEVGDLTAGDTETLVVQVCTGENPQNKQEFTSEEEGHELDGGASASYVYDNEEYESPETEPLTVDVNPEPEDED